MSKYTFEEIVLQYDPEQLKAWKRGDKSLVPDGYEITPNMVNQQSFHFGEYFVLRYYVDRGWNGHVDYAIGDWEPDIARYDSGREAVRQLFSGKGLEEIKDLRKGITSGEPDVFLFKPNGEVKFLEVKKGADTVSAEQLTCMAQIKKLLNADVGIVYLNRRGQTYSPKRYELDTEVFTGRVLGR